VKRIFSSHNQLLVHHSRNLLEAAGIRSELRNLVLASAMGELPPAECDAQLWVEDRDAKRAEEILSSAKADGPDWNCGNCSEVSGPQFAQCWRCGADRPV
jgi:hypothetical protein